MASWVKATRLLCTLVRLQQGPVLNKCRSHGIKGSFLIGGIFGKPKEEPKKAEELPKLETPDPSKLSSEYLIKAASINTAEEVGTLVLQSALALIEAEKEYCEAVYALVVLMEYKLKVLDNKAEEERIWDLVLAGRDLVTRKLRQKRTLEMIFLNSKSMLNTAAEVAYMTGAEFAGSIAGDRIYKVEQHIKQVQLETEEVEMNLRKVETKTVEVEAEHAEKVEESQQTEEVVPKLDEEPKENNEESDDVKEPSDHSDDAKDTNVESNKQMLFSEISNEKLFSEKTDYGFVDSSTTNVQYIHDDQVYQNRDENIEDVSYKFSNQRETVEDDIADKSEYVDKGNEDLKL